MEMASALPTSGATQTPVRPTFYPRAVANVKVKSIAIIGIIIDAIIEVNQRNHI